MYLSIRRWKWGVNAGDPLYLEKRGEGWVMTDSDGVTVCVLSKKYRPPANARFPQGNTFAILTRHREESGEEYRPSLVRNMWGVVLPDLVFVKEG